MKFLLVILLIFTFTNIQADEVSTNNLLVQALKDAGAVSDVKNNLKIELVKGQSMLEKLEKNSVVTKLDFDASKGNFTAFISSNDNLPVEVAGKFAETTKLPALARKFDKNEIISKNDIIMVEIEKSKLRDMYITSEDSLIGKSPTRVIFKERPITLNQVANVKLVSKNKLVSLMYKNNSLTIKTSGIALEDGSIGQSVRIKNASSNRIVHAKIVSDSVAEVEQNHEVASN